MRITAACPDALVSDANHLAMALAFSEADALTYNGLNWVDALGNLYACASFEARDEWVIGAQSPLARPAWDTGNVIDMDAAARAQAALMFWSGVGDIPQASTSALVAIASIGPREAIALAGLSQVVEQA